MDDALNPHPVISKNAGTRFLRAVIALLLREVETRYARVAGGYLWALIEPVATIGFLALVFSVIAHSPMLGSSFALFYATGFLPYAFTMTLSNELGRAVGYSKPLLQYPTFSFLDPIIARLILNLLTHGLVMVIVLVGIVIVEDQSLILNWSRLLLGFSMCVGLGAALGVLNCYLFLASPLWEQVWNVVTRPLFILSGILFLPENFTASVQKYLMLNPFAHVVAVFRSGIYSSYDAQASSPFAILLLSAVLGAVGLLFLSRNYRSLLLR